jgi:hypothetical protein
LEESLLLGFRAMTEVSWKSIFPAGDIGAIMKQSGSIGIMMRVPGEKNTYVVCNQLWTSEGRADAAISELYLKSGRTVQGLASSQDP